ncbi:MAG TPA: OB-fold domain-containing protein [Streptosporangiaceae bacterium]|nr:OB-fold domain-containing protein [Streptosporangiaceae bacterium]
MNQPPQPLHAPLEISFDYTRSLGPTLSAFVTALARRRVLGARASDGRVHAPPFEYDPVSGAPPAEFTEVGPGGSVVSWTWTDGPLDGQPLAHPFGWALIRLDGADTAMLHAVDAGSKDKMRTGMRVTPRWAAQSGNGIIDIACFEPEGLATADGSPSAPADADSAMPAPPEPIGMITSPVRLTYDHTVSPGESSYLLALAEGRLIGQRCPVCGKVYVPPRGACPVDGVPTRDEVQLPDTGVVTTFCVVNVPFQGQKFPSPYVAASVLIDGADIPFQHLILGCPPDEVRMGMRVRAVWKPREEWAIGHNIDHFEPTDEPDAPYDSYAHHL